MSRREYLEAIALLAVVAVPLVAAGRAGARWLLPGWRGARSALAAAVLALALATTTLHVVGAVGAFARVPVVVALMVAGGGLWWISRSRTSPTVHSDGAAEPATRGDVIVAWLIGAAITAQWAGRVAQSYALGMFDADTLAYHLPFAARFVQAGSLAELHLMTPDGAATFQAGDSDMLHGVGILLTGSDLVSPLVNLGWLALALLSAWCIGRSVGAGPACVAGVALLLSTSTFSSTQAGSAMTDVAALALLLAAVALLLEGWPGPPAVAIAGLAAGLSLAMKLTPAVAVAALTAGVLALGRRDRRSALAFVGAMLAGGSFWFFKNLALVGNPVPPLSLGIGGVELPHPEIEQIDRYGHSVLEYVTSGTVWTDWFLPGLEYAFGRGWPLLLGLAVGGGVSAILRPSHPLDRVVGAAAVAALVGYAVTPATALGEVGEPVLFARNLRYAGPAIVLGLVLLPRLPVLRPVPRRRAVLAVLLGAWAITQLAASGEPPWLRDHRLGSLAGALAVLIAAILCGAVHRPARLALAGAAAGVVVIAGWRVQNDYTALRYANSRYTLHSPAWAWAQGVERARIGFAGMFEQYPLYGAELSNHVEAVALETPHHGFTWTSSCRSWREAVNRGRYDYVVLAPPFNESVQPPAEEAWTRGDPSARAVVRVGLVAVYALNGKMDAGDCP